MNRIFILLLLLSFSVVAEELPSIDKYLIKFNTEYFCNNSEYISCVKITKPRCIQSFESAINLCISTMPSDARAPSPVCIADNYIKNSGIAVKEIKSCEHITAKISADYKLSNKPNKAFNHDAQ